MTIKETIRRILYNFINNTNSEGNKIKEANMAVVKSSTSGIRDNDITAMNFNVYHAIGGKVIQFSTYDLARDRTRSTLYVVTDNEDLGEELSQIITKESLTR